ncbi:CPX chromosomal region candidate gene 1 protein [Talpa occidentalis]|uniref:CPX chromosomal region candidate gene 1 protein n=1 Tax=Talpa occidentalis TaxID=50954 RepID=UPI00188EBD67|nr:CPX chromosomal region candidate gene 1 protein [Talpa occidentalis]XP_054551911.1 CPX chromosomal region candidate gene 1 protein [Talpa occidentalis]
MSSPTEEESGSADQPLKNLENEAPNDCNTEVEPSLDNPNTSEVETIPTNAEPGTADIQEEHAVPEAATIDKSEVQNTQEDSQKEDLREESLIVQIPIPRKWILFISGLGRITNLSIQLGKNDKNNHLTDSARFYSRKIEIKVSDLCYHTINYKMPFQLSTSWRIPFISNHEIRRMILRLLCSRHFSQAIRRQNTTWVKQKYIALLPRPNALTQGESALLFGRPLRMYYQQPLTDRIAAGKVFKSNASKGKGGIHIFVRPVFYVPRAHVRNTLARKTFGYHLRAHRNIRVVIININNAWKYLCPICGSSFNNLAEFRAHSCN